jgi:hypothetical protein
MPETVCPAVLSHRVKLTLNRQEPNEEALALRSHTTISMHFKLGQALWIQKSRCTSA